MEMNNEKKNGKKQGWEPLLNADKKVDGFGKEIPDELKSIGYVNKIGSAMRAWGECGKEDQRGYILLAIGECDDGEEDSRSMVVSHGGSIDILINMIMAALDSDKKLRMATGAAIGDLARLANERAKDSKK